MIDIANSKEFHTNTQSYSSVHLDILYKKLHDQYPFINSRNSNTLSSFYLPLAGHIHHLLNSAEDIKVLGISGGQGSGKSSLAGILKIILDECFHLSSVCLSIDDFYLTKEKRIRLSEQIHPLLKTRGVPGTHDVSLALKTLESLKNMQDGDHVYIPRFDKSRDDRVSLGKETLSKRPGLIIFEGWCLGALPQENHSLEEPINTLEAKADPNGIWRIYYNDELKENYQSLFSSLDYTIFLRVPSFEQVRLWRYKQEKELQSKNPKQKSGLMSKEQISEFVMYYERITMQMAGTYKEFSDLCFFLNDQQEISEYWIKK